MKFPGYLALLGPETLVEISTGEGGTPLRREVRTVDDYRAFQERAVTRRHGQVWESDQPVFALVNQGRWVASCHWCRNGMLTRPDWGVAFCGECGARYEEGKVVFPQDHTAIAKILCRRPERATQNWTTDQTSEDLARENHERGVD